MKKTLALAILALCIAAPVAQADDHEGHHKGNMFEKHDTNGDGVISKAEFMAEAEARFAKMDTDGDGNFSKDEAEAFREKMQEKMKEYRSKKGAE